MAHAILNTAKIAIGLIFMAAAMPKLYYPYEFLANIYSYELLGPTTGVLASLILPFLEVAIGVALLLNVGARGALVLATGLGALFVGVQSWALLQGLEISCGCFGDGGTVNYTTLLRTVALFVLIAGTCYASLGFQKTPAASRAAEETTLAHGQTSRT